MIVTPLDHVYCVKERKTYKRGEHKCLCHDQSHEGGKMNLEIRENKLVKKVLKG